MMMTETISVVLASSGSFDFAGMAIWLSVLLFSSAVHESAHAYVAWRCGDPTAREMGRITLNPIAHLDPFYSFLMPAMLLIASNGTVAFGGAKPVPVNYYNLRHPKRDMMWVALAGPVSNIILAVLAAILLRIIRQITLLDISPAADQIFLAAIRVLWTAIYANVILAVFNMVPIPPLDGSRVLARYLTGEAELFYARMEQFGMFILIGLFYFAPGFSGVIFGMARYFAEMLLSGAGA